MYSIVTQNIFTSFDNTNIKRINIFINNIEEKLPDIICLQEVILHTQKEQILKSKIIKSNYHLYFSECYNINYPIKSYIHSFLLFMLIIYNLYYLKILLIIFLLIILLISLPSILLNKIKYITQIIPDHCGLMIGIKKNNFSCKKKIINKFQNQGVSITCYFNQYFKQMLLLLPISIIGIWIYVTYFRHGYMIVECDNIIIINCHLITGLNNNNNRLLQIMEINKYINYFIKNQKKIILCGDFNASPNTKEIMYIKNRIKLKDCWDIYNNDNGFTWNKQNKYTKNYFLTNEHNQRIDYIFTNSSKINKCILVSVKQPVSDHYGIYSKITL